MGHRILLVCLCCFLVSAPLFSQCNEHLPPALTCEEAPFFCLAQQCFQSTLEPFNCCNGWCGANTAIHNPQYFAFVAAEADVEIQIHVDFCDSGNGLQSAILQSCPWDNNDVLDCDPGTPPGGTMVLSANGMIPGQTYWVVVDGSNGALCDYTFTQVNGVEEPIFNLELDSALTFANTAEVCPGYTDLILFAGPHTEGTIYEWTHWNGSIYYSDEPELELFIPGSTDPGVFEVCVRQMNTCDTSETICIPLTVTSPTIATKNIVLCAEAFPYTLHDTIIEGPGSVFLHLVDEHGCAADTIWVIQAYPESPTGTLDTLVCASSFHYYGIDYTQSGIYTVTLESANIYGCDSLVTLTLEIAAPEVMIYMDCENNSQDVLKAVIVEQDANIDTVTLEWYDCAFSTLITNAESFQPDSAGCYSLIVQSGNCVDTLSSFYELNACEQPCTFSLESGCAGSESELALPFVVSQDDNVNWIIQLSGNEQVYFTDEDTVEYSFQAAGDYQVYAIVTENDTTQTCFSNIHIDEGPVVSICCDDSICSSCTILYLINHNQIPGAYYFNGTSNPLTGGISEYLEVCMEQQDTTIINVTGTIGTNGCPGHVVGDSSITVTWLPLALVFIVSINDTLYAYPNDLGNYEWTRCSSEIVLSTEAFFVPDSSGCFVLSTTNSSGCSDQDYIEFIHTNTKSLKEDVVRLYPNPTDALLQIEIQDVQLLPALWVCMDASGKQVGQGIIRENQTSIDFEYLPSGNYFLNFDFGEKGNFGKRLVIE